MAETYTLTAGGLTRELTMWKVNDRMDIPAVIMRGDIELTVAAAAELLKVAVSSGEEPEASALPGTAGPASDS